MTKRASKAVGRRRWRVNAIGAAVAAMLSTSALSPAAADPANFPAGPTAPAGAPNVIVIMTDDVGYGATSTFGGEIPTPNFDRIAQSGLRFANFHTTGFCSPSRAALLTGRNSHAVGFGTVADLARADDGYNSIIPKSASTLAQILRANGFDTAAFGKQHNVPTWQAGPLGPFDQWPSGLGFNYFYGFLGGETNQFAPALVENNNPIDPPNQPGYILDRDLADHALQWLRVQRAEGGGRPFLLYYAPGTAHGPVQAPADWIARFRGKFDDGWDAMRERILERQKRLGLVPPGTKLAPMPPEVKPWNSLTADEKRVYARYMESYAAAVAYADDQVGRIFEDLRRNGQLDNTLVIYIEGDNGSTPEGGTSGQFNYAAVTGGNFQSSLARALAHIDDIGGPRSYPAAPLGYMMAMNTPFPYYKMMASRLGGITNGMAISWPSKLAARGVRGQFAHLTDVMPTVLDLVGIKPPPSFAGVVQTPLDGLSLRYSFNDAKAPEQHRTQYFEVFGNASLYKDGWFVASPVPAGGLTPGVAANAPRWQLYDLKSDYSQTTDVADRFPEKLQEMRSAFDIEARRNKVFPISYAGLMDIIPQNRPEVTARTGSYTFYPSNMRYAEGVFPSINNRSFSIEADLDTSAGGSADGMLVTQGGRFSGWGLALFNGTPTFLYRTNDSPESLTRLAAPTPLSPGQHHVGLAFKVDGPGLGRGGALTLTVDGKVAAAGRLERTVAVKFGSEGASVGRDAGTPLADDYQLPFAANSLQSVTINLEPAQIAATSSGNGAAGH